MSFDDVFGSVRSQVAVLFHVRPCQQSRKARRLLGEHLERRCVLSVAPLEVESDVPSLESYIAEEPAMGPVEPEAANAADDGELPPEAADQYFSDESSEGEESEPVTGDGGGDAGSGGAGEGEGELVDDDIGAGGSVVANTAPMVTTFGVRPDLEDENFIFLYGTVSDDGLLEGCTIDFGGIIADSTAVASDGSFELRIQRPDFSGTITASARDIELTSETVELYFDRQ